MSDGKYDIKPPKNAQFFTASAATYAVLADLRYGVERFDDFHKWCLDGVRDMSFSGNYQFHTAEFEMLPWKAIYYPEDMVDWGVIGFRCGDQVKAFIKDDRIPLVRDTVNCEPQPFSNCTIDQCADIGLGIPFYDGGYVGGNHYYGRVCTGAAGYFTADDKNRIFTFTKLVTNVSKVYLQWIGDGINADGRTIIHPYFFKPLQYFIHWQRKLFDKNFSQGERDAAEALYNKSFDKAMVQKMDLSVDDIMDILRRNYTQLPKG